MPTDCVDMVAADLDSPWLIGIILIAVWVVISVATEAFLLNGTIREGIIRGLFGGSAFAVVYLFLRWRSSNDEL